MQHEDPTAAGLMYSDTGGDGQVVVLLHGVLMNGTLWDVVVGGSWSSKNGRLRGCSTAGTRVLSLRPR